jgi:hypothetical protein
MNLEGCSDTQETPEGNKNKKSLTEEKNEDYRGQMNVECCSDEKNIEELEEDQAEKNLEGGQDRAENQLIPPPPLVEKRDNPTQKDAEHDGIVDLITQPDDTEEELIDIQAQFMGEEEEYCHDGNVGIIENNDRKTRILEQLLRQLPPTVKLKAKATVDESHDVIEYIHNKEETLKQVVLF